MHAYSDTNMHAHVHAPTHAHICTQIYVYTHACITYTHACNTGVCVRTFIRGAFVRLLDQFRSHMESCIHMLVCQRHIPGGLWIYVKDTAIIAIQTHGIVYLYVGACVGVYMYCDS